MRDRDRERERERERERGMRRRNRIEKLCGIINKRESSRATEAERERERERERRNAERGRKTAQRTLIIDKYVCLKWCERKKWMEYECGKEKGMKCSTSKR